MKNISYRILLVFLVLFPIWEGVSIEYQTVGPLFLGIVLMIVWVSESFKSGLLLDINTTVLMSLLFVSFLFGTFQSIDLVDGVSKAVSLFSVIFLFIITVDLLSRRDDIDEILMAYVLGMYIFSLTMIFNVIHSITYLDLYNRYSAIGTDPNNFAIMLATALPVLLYFFEKSKKKYKIISFVLLIQFSFLIVSTASRSGVVSMGLIFLFYFLSNMKLNFRNFIYLIALSGAVVYILNSFLIDFIPVESLERLENIQNSDADKEEGGRLFLWSKAIDLLSDNWMLGIGVDSFLRLTSMQVHNTFLYFYLSGGFIGFIAWLSVWTLQLSNVLLIFKKRSSGVGFYMLLLLIPLLLGAMTLNWEMRKSVYVLFGIISATKILTLKERKIKIESEIV